jgi:hypothetical protein
MARRAPRAADFIAAHGDAAYWVAHERAKQLTELRHPDAPAHQQIAAELECRGYAQHPNPFRHHPPSGRAKS